MKNFKIIGAGVLFLMSTINIAHAEPITLALTGIFGSIGFGSVTAGVFASATLQAALTVPAGDKFFISGSREEYL